MSASDEGGQAGPVPPGEGRSAVPGQGTDEPDGGLGGWLAETQLAGEAELVEAERAGGPGAMFRDDPLAREVRLRAEQPAGAVFALGYAMAELFDPRRQASAVAAPAAFDPQTQLPLVADLTADDKLVFLAAQVREYLHWFPRLRHPLRRVTAEASKKKPGATPAEPFSGQRLLAAVTGLHQAILDAFADDPERLSAYQLGLALSDLVWLPSGPASRPGTLLALFGRAHLTTVQTLLNGAGGQLPAGSAAIVSRSLDNWADWVDVNSARLVAGAAGAWSPDGDATQRALRAQGWVWRSVLIADPEVSVQPAIGAWVEGASSVARAAGRTSWVFVRRFWPLVLLALAALGGLLYLVISSLSGASQVWASLATVAAALGSGGWSLSSGVSGAFDAVGSDVWAAARLDAAAWNITWLPALTATTSERIKMAQRGVAMPQVRKSLDG